MTPPEKFLAYWAVLVAAVFTYWFAMGRMTRLGRTLLAIVILAAGAIAIISVSGCSTVTQKPVVSAAASYDGNNQNSGILAKLADGSYAVTAHFRDRYNALVGIYGCSKLTDGSPIFAPALVKDAGLTAIVSDNALDLYHEPAWHMTKQAMSDMVVLSDLKRRGFKP